MDDVNARPPRSVGADALKAFTHPLRRAMVDHLQAHGPATATQLARALGESTGQTSYHLRQLERHGFVEDDPDHVGGRERWWRAVAFWVDGVAVRQEPGGAEVVASTQQWAVAERLRVLTRWVETVEPDPAWAGVGSSARATGELTVAEAEALTGELEAVVRRHLEAARDAVARDAGAAEAEGAVARRRVRVYLDVLPLPTD
jgi:DNA-binding transcriptional ArsR family regulator